MRRENDEELKTNNDFKLHAILTFRAINQKCEKINTRITMMVLDMPRPNIKGFSYTKA